MAGNGSLHAFPCLLLAYQGAADAEFTRLSQLQQLTEVQIGGFDVDCSALRAAACCSALQRLAIVDAPHLADPGLTCLSALSALTCLNLASNKPAPAHLGMTDTGILALVGLTRLRLTFCSHSSMQTVQSKEHCRFKMMSSILAGSHLQKHHIITCPSKLSLDCCQAFASCTCTALHGPTMRS